MRTVRGRLTGVIVLTTLGLALAGCTSDNSPAGDPAPGAAVPADPKQALASSTQGLAEGNFSFTLTGYEQKGSGVVHKPSNSARTAMTFGTDAYSMNIEIIYVEPDMWAKTLVKSPELPPAKQGSGKWQHIDPGRAQDNKNLQFDWTTSDLVGGQAVIKAAKTVERVADGSYSGTTDLSTLTDSPVIDVDLISELGAQAKSVPYQATLDEKGRLSTLTLKMPVAGDTPAYDLKITYSGYGAATATPKPSAAEAEEATDETYEMLW